MIRTHELRPQKNGTTKGKERVCGYARVSSTRQGSEKGFGLDTQRKAIVEYALKHNLDLHDVYSDVISGTEESMEARVAYWQMLQLCEKENIKKIIILDVSRLFRDSAAVVRVKKDLLSRSIEVYSINQPQYSIHSKDPSEFLISSIMDTLSTWDRLTLVGKLKAGRLEKVKQGRYPGTGVPLGFQVHNRELIINEIELKLVKYIYRLRRRGLTAYNISLRLNAAGIVGKRGGLFTPTTVKRILKSKIYKGFIKYGNKLYPSQIGRVL